MMVVLYSEYYYLKTDKKIMVHRPLNSPIGLGPILCDIYKGCPKSNWFTKPSERSSDFIVLGQLV